MKSILFILLVFTTISVVAQNEEKELLLSGKACLIKLIKANGDTIYENNSKLKIKVVLTKNNNDNNSKEKIWLNQSDSIFHYISFNTEAVIYFICKGYKIKGLKINTKDIPNNTLGYKVGFEFPYTIYLLKKNKTNKASKKIVAYIKYDKTNEYFNFELQEE